MAELHQWVYSTGCVFVYVSACVCVFAWVCLYAWDCVYACVYMCVHIYMNESVWTLDSDSTRRWGF